MLQHGSAGIYIWINQICRIPMNLKNRKHWLFLYCGLILLLSISSKSFSQTLFRDTHFNSNALTTNSEVRSVEVLNDPVNKGKVILGGSFNNYNNNSSYQGVVRLNPDGSVDQTFSPPTTFTGTVYTVAVQPWDNKILIGGTFTVSHSGIVYRNIARLDADGELDLSFNPGGNGTDGAVWKVLILDPEKRIVVGGVFNSYLGSSIRAAKNQGGALILNENGSLYKNLKVTDGVWASGGVYCMGLDKNGKILIGGEFGEIDGVLVRRAARLNRDGSLDPAFLNKGYEGVGPSGTVYSIVAQPDNKILIGGVFDSYVDMSIGKWTNVPRTRLARLNENGYLDNSFNYAGGFLAAGFNNGNIKDFLVDAQGRIFVVGSFTEYRGKAINNIIRILSDGSNDASFNVGTGFNNLVFDIDFQNWRNGEVEPEAHLIVGGLYTSYNSYNGQPFAVRLINSDVVVLPKYINEISCKRVSNNQIQIRWQSYQSGVTYHLEKSIDGRNFKTIASLQSTLINNNIFYEDRVNYTAKVYYRVKITSDVSGLGVTKLLGYTEIEYVDLNAEDTRMTVSRNKLHINISAATTAVKLYNIQIVTLGGQLLFSKTLTVADNNLDTYLLLPSSLNDRLVVLSDSKGEMLEKIVVAKSQVN
jgi:uncharacterized delta-60 repeat protein